jgi:hypothetical protein
MEWSKKMGQLESLGALGRDLALFRATVCFSPQVGKRNMRIGKRSIFRASADGRWKVRNKPFCEWPV